MTQFKIPKVNLELRKNTWFYSYYFERERYRGTTGEHDKRAAQFKAEGILAAHLRESISTASNLPDLMPSNDLLKKYIQDKIDRDRQPGTINNLKRYADKFNEYFHGKPLAQIETPQIGDWALWLKKQHLQGNGVEHKTLGPKSIREHIDFISSVCKINGIKNPCRGVERPKKSRADYIEHLKFYSEKELQKLLDTLDTLVKDELNSIQPIGKSENGEDLYDGEEDFKGLWFQFSDWFKLMTWTGIRLGEMQGIRFKDINHELQKIRVISQKTKDTRPLRLKGIGAGDKSWEVLVRLEIQAIKFYRSLEFRKTETAIPEEADNFLDRVRLAYAENTLYTQYESWFYKTLRTCCKIAKVRFKGVHSIRHSFATMALQKEPIYKVAKWLGHKNIQLTHEIYGHLTDNEESMNIWAD